MNIRPWAKEFLREVTKYFEVVVFTASEKTYANKAIKLLDPNKEFIRGRLYRNSCTWFNPLLVKDLNILGRDLSKTVIVDNSPNAFALNVFQE